MPKVTPPQIVDFPRIRDNPALGDPLLNENEGIYDDDTTDIGSNPTASTAAPPLFLKQQGDVVQVATANFIIDGGGSAITTGEKGWLVFEFSCIIERITAFVDTGTITVDAWKTDYANFPPTDDDSITGGSPFNITSAQKYENNGLSDWTTLIKKGDIIAFNVDAVSSATRCTLGMRLRKV